VERAVKLKREQLVAVIGLGVLAIVTAAAGLLLAVLPQRSHAGRLDAIRAAQLFQLARAMPDNSDMPSIVNDLARAADLSSVTIVSISQQPQVAQPDGAMALPMQVTVSGGWNGMAAFLRTLRGDVQAGTQRLLVNGRLFTIDNVDLTAGGASTTGNAPEVTAILRLNAFSYGVATTQTTSTGPSTTTTTTTTPGSAAASGSTG
jgi:hypothetical protein